MLLMTGRKIVELGPGEYPMRTRYTPADYLRKDRSRHSPIHLKPGETYYPVDSREGILKDILARAPKDVEVRPVKANLKSLPFADGSVDEVHASGIGGMMQALYQGTSRQERGDEQLVPDGSLMLSEASRILAPGGRIYLHATVYGSKPERERDLGRIQENLAEFGFSPGRNPRVLCIDKAASVSSAARGLLGALRTGKMLPVTRYVTSWRKDYRKPHAQVVLEFRKK